jgi:simple sugar transport system ATP-binding protein
MQNITKTFGDKITANKSVNFRVRRGVIHALVGENGAGKTTLMKILYGMYMPDAGTIRINGKEEKIHSPSRAIALEIGMVHQHFMLVRSMNILENIILGDESTGLFGILDLKACKKKVEQLIQSYNIKVDIQAMVSNIAIGEQQRVEILKILYRNAGILILDEPTSVLTPREINDLFNTLNDLKSKGKTIILITHKLDEVMAVSDSVSVMKQGEIAGEFETGSTNKEELSRLMIGSEAKYEPVKEIKITRENVLEVVNLSVLNDKGVEAVKNVSLSIGAGEIFGIAGVEGNGQNELVEAVTGIRKVENGTIRISGRSFKDRHARSLPTAHIPADRHKNGIVLDFTVSGNLILGRQREKEFSSKMLLKDRRINEYSIELADKFDIRPKEPDVEIRKLSGGNQQKVVVARELSKQTDLIVASHPTRGLDIKATSFVHNTILNEKAKGRSILLVSSDLSELMKLSDRIGVMFNGELVVVMRTEEATEEELGMYMTGAKGIHGS